jgi:hypothetical protein
MEEVSKSSESIISHDGRDSGISAPAPPDFDMVDAVAVSHLLIDL